MIHDAGLPARVAALTVLEAVLASERPLERALSESRELDRLSPSDRSFVRLLLSTTLRRLRETDANIESHLRKPLPPRAARVRQILRLGAAQLMYLATPPHAAVDTAVRLVKSSGPEGFAGLVNAILRRIAGTKPLGEEDAGRVNTPPWLWQSWERSYGSTATTAIAGAHLREAPLDLSAKDETAVDLSELGAVRTPTGSLRVHRTGNPAELPGFSDGAFWIQDAGAALPARLFPDPRGRRIIDLCAAPGGKAAQLAAAGAMVTAVDRAEDRLRLLTDNFRRLRLPVQIVAADATRWRPGEPADDVLLDAPCTATGTIRRHPDIPHLKRPGDALRLAAIQGRLIDSAAEMVRAGGHLIYAVCSLQPEEGPDVVDAFLARNDRFTRAGVLPGEISGLEPFLTPDGDLRTLPCHWRDIGGIDGFYAARLRRL